MLSREEIMRIKEEYPKDTQVRLYSMKGEPQMPIGMKGKVKLVDDIGQIHVSWENGSTLPLNTEEDQFDIITQEEIISEQKSQEFIDKVNQILADVDFKLLNISCNSENTVYAAEKLLAMHQAFEEVYGAGYVEECYARSRADSLPDWKPREKSIWHWCTGERAKRQRSSLRHRIRC